MRKAGVCVLCLAIFLAFTEQSFAQRKKHQINDAYEPGGASGKDSTYDEIPKRLFGCQLFGDLGFGGAAAEQYLSSKKIINFSLREGIGIIPGSHEEPPPYIESVLILVAGPNLIIGNHFAFEAGIAPGVWISKPSCFMTTINLGLRVQNLGNSDLYFRAGFNTFIYPYKNRTISVFPFSVGFGKCF